MAEVRWTDSALLDIDGIAEFIAEDSEKYAQIQVERFFREAEILEKYPFAGRIVPELQDQYIKEIVCGNYRLSKCYCFSKYIIKSIILDEYPISLSYHPTTFTILSITDVSCESNRHELRLPNMSTDTMGSSV